MPPSQTTRIDENLKLRDLDGTGGFSKLLERFFQAIGIPNALIGRDGEFISHSGSFDVRARFHGEDPDSGRRRRARQLEPEQDLRSGEIACRVSDNGLTHYAAPVVVEGRHLATLFLGQVFGEPPDMAFFREEAARYGFDETEYLEAIRSVPVVGKARMKALTECMLEAVHMRAFEVLGSLRRPGLDVDANLPAEQRIPVTDLLNFSPVGIGWSDAAGQIEYLNLQFTKLFGYTLDDLPDIATWFLVAYPDPTYRRDVIEPWNREVALARYSDTTPPELEASIICKDGSERRVFVRASWIRDKRLVNFSDITAHWQSELRNRTHDAMLEMVARGAPLTDILNAIVRAVESEEPAWMCSVLLMDAAGEHLRIGVAPSLPGFFNEACDGMEIGMATGSCGRSAYLGKRVIVADIMAHEHWRPVRELARRAGVAACWSEPVLASDGKVLGTFAIYHAQPATPNPEEIDRITFASNLAAIAIENRNTREELVERARTFRTLAENAPDNIARYDTECRLIYHNPLLEKTVGIPSAQMLGKRPTEHVSDSRFDNYEAKIRYVVETGEATEFELEMPTPNGKDYHWLHMVAERDDAGTITGVLAMGRDITERRSMEAKLAAREREFRTLAENAPVMIARYDVEGRVTYVNPRLADQFHGPIDRMLGRPLVDVYPDSVSQRLHETVMHTLQSGEDASLEAEFPGKGGGVQLHIIHMVAERDAKRAVTGVLAMGQDITERKRMEQELERQAHSDYLTGLANRRHFLEQAESELARIERYGGELSLIMFDIDHFKRINDTRGHSIGDLVLQTIATTTRETMRESDIIGRIGGEEFVVLLPETGTSRAVEAAERLRSAIAASEVRPGGGEPLCVTASFGVVTLADASKGIDELLIRADTAMYEAKGGGRNRVCLSPKSETSVSSCRP